MQSSATAHVEVMDRLPPQEYAAYAACVKQDFQTFTPMRCVTTGLEYWKSQLDDFEHISPFRMLGSIGKGSSGHVFAVQFKLKPFTIRAAKKFEFGTAYIHSDELKRAKTWSKFFHEATILSELKHPNITLFEGAIMCPQYAMLYMEFCDYGALSRNIGHFSLDLMQLYFVQICSAFSYLHNKRIVHRDLKLDNILVRSKDSVALADFGLAERLDEKSNIVLGRCGTWNFMAPEVKAAGIKDCVDGIKADAYSVGVVVWCMLMGTTHPMANIPASWDHQPVRDELLSYATRAVMEMDPADRCDVTSVLELCVGREDACWRIDKNNVLPLIKSSYPPQKSEDSPLNSSPPSSSTSSSAAISSR